MFGFDKMFDFNHDGNLDSFEQVAQFQFLDEMMKEDYAKDVFTNAGLDPDELEFMDLNECIEALEDAGLDPDEFDF